MAKKEPANNMTERFFIRTTPEVRKALLHLAIDHDATAEKLAGLMLALALERVSADIKTGKLIPPRKRE